MTVETLNNAINAINEKMPSDWKSEGHLSKVFPIEIRDRFCRSFWAFYFVKGTSETVFEALVNMKTGEVVLNGTNPITTRN